ncbi:MAG TPA: PilZ domain-containing protein [Blastocatellia bacterium]|jgi:hypothetical protein
MKKTFTEEQATQLKYLTENMARMLDVSHQAAGQHRKTDCSICKVIEKTREIFEDIYDRRRSKRVAYLMDVEGNGEATGRFSTRLSDISLTGAFMDSVTSFPERTTFELRFKIGAKTVRVNCEVRYAIEHIGMGIRFMDLKSSDREALEKFLASKG